MNVEFDPDKVERLCGVDVQHSDGRWLPSDTDVVLASDYDQLLTLWRNRFKTDQVEERDCSSCGGRMLITHIARQNIFCNDCTRDIYEPMFGTRIREVAAVIKDWWRTRKRAG